MDEGSERKREREEERRKNEGSKWRHYSDTSLEAYYKCTPRIANVSPSFRTNFLHFPEKYVSLGCETPSRGSPRGGDPLCGKVFSGAEACEARIEAIFCGESQSALFGVCGARSSIEEGRARGREGGDREGREGKGVGWAYMPTTTRAK